MTAPNARHYTRVMRLRQRRDTVPDHRQHPASYARFASHLKRRCDSSASWHFARSAAIMVAGAGWAMMVRADDNRLLDTVGILLLLLLFAVQWINGAEATTSIERAGAGSVRRLRRVAEIEESTQNTVRTTPKPDGFLVGVATAMLFVFGLVPMSVAWQAIAAVISMVSYTTAALLAARQVGNDYVRAATSVQSH